MYYLEETFGNDGFATFVKILRELAGAEYHFLNLSKKTTKMFLSAKCKVSVETLDCIINALVDLEKFDRDLWEKKQVIWCQDFVDSIQDAYKKRSNECITKEGLVSLLNGLGIPKQGLSKSEDPVKPQTILDYTKLEKTKLERGEHSPPRALDFLKEHSPQKFETQFLMKYKSQIKDFEKFCDDFNDTCDQEELEYTVRAILGRLGKYARNWIRNQDKFKGPEPPKNSVSRIPVG